MTQLLFVGSAMSADFVPRPIESFPGVLTASALVVKAANAEEAHVKVRRWHTLREEIAPLIEETGHIWCFQPDDPRFAGCCDRHADLAAKKQAIEAECHEIAG